MRRPWNIVPLALSLCLLSACFDASGVAQREWTVAGDGTNHDPDVSVAAGGAVAIAWQDDGDDNGAYQIRGATWQASGADWLAERTLNAQATGQQYRPAVGLIDDGTLVVLWTDDMDGNDKGQIFAAGFDAP